MRHGASRSGRYEIRLQQIDEETDRILHALPPLRPANVTRSEAMRRAWVTQEPKQSPTSTQLIRSVSGDVHMSFRSSDYIDFNSGVVKLPPMDLVKALPPRESPNPRSGCTPVTRCWDRALPVTVNDDLDCDGFRFDPVKTGFLKPRDTTVAEVFFSVSPSGDITERKGLVETARSEIRRLLSVPFMYEIEPMKTQLRCSAHAMSGSKARRRDEI